MCSLFSLQITSLDGSAVGYISKTEGNYNLQFIEDLDVAVKAAILGACVLMVNK